LNHGSHGAIGHDYTGFNGVKKLLRARGKHRLQVYPRRNPVGAWNILI
jgi:hypothetical protein